MSKIMLSVVTALLLVLCATPTYAVPVLPHTFYGSVTVDGSAPDEILVSATVVNGSVLTNSQNPVTAVGDSYGINSPRLLVQGDNLGGAITFYVNSVEAGSQPAVIDFEVGGGPTRVDLSVVIEPEPEPEPEPTPSPPSGNGAGGGEPTYSGKGDLFGTDETFYTDYSGEVQKTVEATSEDGNLTITIPKGTVALGKDSKRLKTLEVAVDESPPDPPGDVHIIGLAYDFGPAGAMFQPAITLTWSYDPNTLPKDVPEESLIVAFYNRDVGEWIGLVCVVNTETNTLTASVTHFTSFCVMGSVLPPTVVEPVPEPVPPLVVTVPLPEPAPVLIVPIPIPEPAPEPIPAPEPLPAPVLPPEPEPSPVNWLGAVLFIALGIAVIAVVWVLWRRRRR